jgi:hypothetical protein
MKASPWKRVGVFHGAAGRVSSDRGGVELPFNTVGPRPFHLISQALGTVIGEDTKYV